MTNTLQREKALSAADQTIAQGKATQAAQVYIPGWAGVNPNGHVVVIVPVTDVAQVVEAVQPLKGTNVLVLFRFESSLTTPYDAKEERFGLSWMDVPHPRRNPERFFEVMRNGGRF